MVVAFNWRCSLAISILVSVSYTHLRAHETPEHLVCRLLLEKKKFFFFFFFLMIRRPPRSTLDRSSAASDVYKRQRRWWSPSIGGAAWRSRSLCLSLIHISEPTRLLSISYAVFCLKKKNFFFFFFF